jgi:DNA-binding NarL/FixJ family response regulator
MRKRIRIGIADDQRLFREGLSKLLKDQEGVEVVLTAKNGIDLLSQLSHEPLDIVIVDYKMPGMDGVDVSVTIQKRYPEVKTLLLSMYDDRDLIHRAMLNGVNGFLTKSIGVNEIIMAIKAIMLKGYYTDNSSDEELLRTLVQNQQQLNLVKPRFSEIEIQVIELICKEYSTKEIAEKIFRGVRTVEGIRSTILKKTGARNSNGIVMYAIKSGLVEV